MAKVMTARRADTCGDCGKSIAAGTTINYGGPGAVTHEACKPMDAPRRTARRSGRYGYTSSGRGRCEDSPCCGCCD